MIKKIKKFFRKRKEKKKMEIEMQAEVLETLASICLYLENEGRYSHNYYAKHMRGHFEGLKKHSDILRKEVGKDDKSNPFLFI